MKTLLWKLLPGALATALALSLGSAFAAKSETIHTPTPAQSYAEDPLASQRVAGDTRGRHRDRDRGDACRECGRAYERREHRGEHYRGDCSSEPAQVVYVVHVTGVQDLRAWPQSIFPHQRFATPIRTFPPIAACGY